MKMKKKFKPQKKRPKFHKRNNENIFALSIFHQNQHSTKHLIVTNHDQKQKNLWMKCYRPMFGEGGNMGVQYWKSVLGDNGGRIEIVRYTLNNNSYLHGNGSWNLLLTIAQIKRIMPL